VGRWRMRYEIPTNTRVSIIIASGGKEKILRTNLRSILQKTTYSNYEIVVVDNSRAERIEKLLKGFRDSSGRIRYVDWRDKPFNYSLINNAAARQCDSPVLLFLNDDTSVISGEWLEAMLELAMRPEVGAVGAKLIYPDGRIQHAGVIMGLYDNCGHAFKGLDGSVRHYFDFSDIIRNVSAVTGACLMTRTEVFWKANGFNENEFAVAFNDIDLCLKIGELGYRVLYTPYAQLYHYEAFSKTSKDLLPHPNEVAGMRMKWANLIVQDPFYSPNLTRNDENYSLRTRS
jgi:GT2 family glycosyltransferase